MFVVYSFCVRLSNLFRTFTGTYNDSVEVMEIRVQKEKGTGLRAFTDDVRGMHALYEFIQDPLVRFV